MSLPTVIAVRSFASAADLDTIDAVTETLPNSLHRIDLPWRLASPATRDPTNIRLWESPDGQLVGWAIIQFQWHCLDYEIVPGPDRDSTETDILVWATSRLAQIAAVQRATLPFYVSARHDDHRRRAAGVRAGFLLDGWSYVHMAHQLQNPIESSNLPAGFLIRSLTGESEVPAYVEAHRAAFGSANMTIDWRSRTLTHRRYVGELDLVAEAPDGTVAAFCVGWLLRSALGGHVVQVEPLGVRPGYQRMGLGRALLMELFRRAQAFGATRIEVNAESYNDASRTLYEAAGFRAEYEIPFARRSFTTE